MFEKAPNNINVTFKTTSESLSLFLLPFYHNYELAVKINSIRFFYPIKRMIYQLLVPAIQTCPFLSFGHYPVFFFCFERGSYIQAGIGLKQVTYMHFLLKL